MFLEAIQIITSHEFIEAILWRCHTIFVVTCYYCSNEKKKEKKKNSNEMVDPI